MKKYLVSIVFLPIVIVLFYFKSTKPAPFSSDLDRLLFDNLKENFDKESMLNSYRMSRSQKNFYNVLNSDSLFMEMHRFERHIDTITVMNADVDSMLSLELKDIGLNLKPYFDSRMYDKFSSPVYLNLSSQGVEKLKWYRLKISYFRSTYLRNMALTRGVGKRLNTEYKLHSFFTKNKKGDEVVKLKFVHFLTANTFLNLGSYKDSFKYVFPIEIPVSRFLKEDQTVTIKQKEIKTGQIMEYSAKINIELK